MGSTERPIGILVALAEEEAALAAALAGERTHPGPDGPVRVGTLDGLPVVLARTGIGRVAAASVATILCDRHGARALLFSGVAGGVAPDLAIGDVVIADRLVDLDYGRREDAGLLRYRPGSLPLPGIPVPADPGFRADPALLAAADAALGALALPARSYVPGTPARVPAIRRGTIATGGAFVASEVARDAIGAATGALAVEMEGTAIAEVAERHGVRWLVVRALSDRAGTTSGADFPAFVTATAENAAAIVRSLLPHIP